MSDAVGTETSAIEHLDSFPYRHTVAEMMSAPLATARIGDTVAVAARRMASRGVSSIVVLSDAGAEQGAAGIVTERDVLRVVAAHGPGGLELPLGKVMSSPVESVAGSAKIFVALGRMARLGVRHLLVTSDDGAPIGMISARTLLRQRATEALAIGDAVAVASDAEALRRIMLGLPTVAGQLRAEHLTALETASVISNVLRDITARAVELAQEILGARGFGPPPAAFCYLVLGSAGRGESLLAADQDNAIVHAGTGDDDAWFSELGRTVSGILDRAGVPYCKGGVMGSRPAWRRPLDEWKATIDDWVRRAEGENLLNIDIFYDFAPVAGDRALAGELRAYADEAARGAPMLVRMMVADIAQQVPPIGLFGRIRTVDGRLDCKKFGLFPLVAAARAIALCHRVEAGSTVERLAGAAEAGALNAADQDALAEAYETLLGLVLDQQVTDMGAGHAPSTHVDVGALGRSARQRLKDALRHAANAAVTARDVTAGHAGLRR